ncbi:hypothetical protein OS493_032055 [Desmophyllum pertusum]|uniref:Uncharacterized protein n=1 Tax=Desmophyllum pertusum TaxID=174260 RepID=A0A9W9YXE7_9CNID|nr:hypothetical protein OS493_032055 [Desmophyllum pertusum]
MDHLLEPFRKLISFLFGAGGERLNSLFWKVSKYVQFPYNSASSPTYKKSFCVENQLSDIPWSVIYLKQLKELDISFNALHILPRIVGHIPTLEVLSVRNNFIAYLPTELLNLPKLKSLDVQDNPLTSPPPEIVEQGLHSILDYLRRRKSRKNLFSNFKPWFSEDDSPGIVEVSTLFELAIKCILDCHIEFLSARYIPPRLKSNLEDTRKEEQSSIFICKCNVCKKYFSNQFKFEIHDCGTKLMKAPPAFSQRERLTQV